MKRTQQPNQTTKLTAQTNMSANISFKNAEIVLGEDDVEYYAVLENGNPKKREEGNEYLLYNINGEEVWTDEEHGEQKMITIEDEELVDRSSECLVYEFA